MSECNKCPLVTALYRSHSTFKMTIGKRGKGKRQMCVCVGGGGIEEWASEQERPRDKWHRVTIWQGSHCLWNNFTRDLIDKFSYTEHLHSVFLYVKILMIWVFHLSHTAVYTTCDRRTHFVITICHSTLFYSLPVKRKYLLLYLANFM